MSEENNNTENKNEETKNTTKKTVNKNSDELAKTGPPTKFIGFYRKTENSGWSLLSQMLASEESIIAKINLMFGDCEIHIINVDLPK